MADEDVQLPSGSRLWTSPIWAVLLLGACTFVLAWVCLTFARDADGAPAAVWPVNAVALAVLLRSPRRHWTALLLATAVGNFAAGIVPTGDWWAPLGLALCNVLEIVSAAMFLRWLTGPEFDLSRRRDLVAFAIAAFCAPALSGAGASLIVSVLHGVPAARAFRVWYLGNMLGFLIVTPALLMARLSEIKTLLSRSQWIRTALVVGGQVALIAATGLEDFFGLRALVFAAFLLPAIALDLTGAAIGTLLGSIVFLGAAAVHAPVMVGGPVRAAVLMQVFLAVTTTASLVLASTLADRRRLKASLDATLLQFQMLAENANDLVTAADMQGRLTYVSPICRQLTGFEPAELIGRHAFDMVHPDDRMGLTEDLGRVLLKDEGDPVYFRIARKDGRVIWVEARPRIRHDPTTGAAVAITDVIRDITQRKEMEEAVGRSEARYRQLADHSTDIILQTDPQGIIQYISPACRQLGYAEVEMVGRSSLDFIHSEARDLTEARSVDLYSGRVRLQEERREYHALCKDGASIWLEGHASLVRNDKGEVVGAISHMRDVTARRAMEEALAAKCDEAEAAVLAKSEFLANMSHEIRTPLTGIIGFAGLLDDINGLPPAAARYVDRIVTAGQALLSVVNDILDFSKIEAGQLDLDPHPFDPRSFIAETLDLTSAQAVRKGLSLSCEIDDDLPAAVFADSSRVRQVLLNLLNNAIKFTERGGVTVRVNYLTAGVGHLQITVADTGMGIPAEKLGRLFQRFSQVDSSTSRSYGGTGLGLVICRTLTEMMGGEIGVDSGEGVGSTFWFRIAAPVADLGAPAPMVDSPDLDIRPARILIVDDVAANRELVSVMLTALGHTLAEASSGQEAVEAAMRESFDLILMDLQMPGMDGLAASRAIRGAWNLNLTTPIVALSANAMATHVAECSAAGMNDHIAKPIDPVTLLTKVALWTSKDRDGQDAEAA